MEAEQLHFVEHYVEILISENCLYDKGNWLKWIQSTVMYDLRVLKRQQQFAIHTTIFNGD